MWGRFQQSELRIEISATEKRLRDSILRVEQLQKWFFPLNIIEKKEGKEELSSGDKFTFKIGLLEVENCVETINSNCIRIILSGAIDGYQEWCWGDGWIQSRLEGVSLLPLSLAQTFNLLRLKSWVERENPHN
ncbi:MAG: hypothetical protein RML10_07025 [Geminocystis sp.]|nr:hypothetical protein [Geminocystis sp.]MDW8463334.1 hypothetical protein [Geminocystis sp.]